MLFCGGFLGVFILGGSAWIVEQFQKIDIEKAKEYNAIAHLKISTFWFMSTFGDKDGCGCYLILVGIVAVAWIATTIFKNSSGGSSNTPPATKTSTPYTPPPSSYTPTYTVPVQQTEPVRYSRRAKTPDDAYNEGYDDGYEQGREDGRNGYSHGANYDDSSDYYDYYETKYQEGYESGYDDGYSEGESQYEDEEESDEEK